MSKKKYARVGPGQQIHFLVVGPHVWGRGTTYEEGLKACREAGLVGRRYHVFVVVGPKDVAAYYLPRVDEIDGSPVTDLRASILQVR